jgi:hypothetical protein
LSKLLLFTDAHAHPDHPNNRADWLGQLIIDEKPDIVVDGGDTADMPSLSSYDKGKRNFIGKSYKKDIEAHNDFQDRVWSPVKSRKKKMPRRVRLIGNHDERIDRALNLSPELEGTIGYHDLLLDDYYDEVVNYKGGTPGIINIEGVSFAHYFITGVSGKGISGEHPAYTILMKKLKSCVQGHTHVLDYCVRTDVDGTKIHGLVAGVYQDYESDWAGDINTLWWRGCVILDNLEGGQYDLRTISLKSLEQTYG